MADVLRSLVGSAEPMEIVIRRALDTMVKWTAGHKALYLGELDSPGSAHYHLYLPGHMTPRNLIRYVGMEASILCWRGEKYIFVAGKVLRFRHLNGGLDINADEIDVNNVRNQVVDVWLRSFDQALEAA